MNKIKTYLLLTIAFIAFPLFGQNKKNIGIKKYVLDQPVCTLPLTDKVEHHHQPYIFQQERSLIKTRNTVINFTYSSTVPEAAKVAMEDGISPILKDIISSDIPINISVTFRELAPGSLASAGPDAWYSNFDNNQVFDAVFPVALAEKIARRELNSPNDPDINVNVSIDQDWYYDFKNPGGIGSEYDFVTVLLHEIIHGLGFSPFAGLTTSDLGLYGVFDGGKYTRYSDLMYLGNGVKITDIEDLSLDLASAFQSNNLFYRINSLNSDFKLYAPPEFNPGSSISHFDENTFNGTESALMTPFISRGVIENQLGLTQDLLYNLGWSFTYIDHEPGDLIESTPDIPFEVSATIDSDAGYSSNDVVVHISYDEFQNIDSSIVMSSVGSDEFMANIPSQGIEGEVQYYFEVTDNRDQAFYEPGTNLDGSPRFYTYYFGKDRGRPNVFHDPISTISDSEVSLPLDVNASDRFTGVDSVIVAWKINGEIQDTLTLEFDEENPFEDDRYFVELVFPRKLIAADEIEYRFIAVDKAESPNLGTAPARSGFYKTTIVPALVPTLSYVNDFDVPSDDFSGDFTIDQPLGFANPALHSPHPYRAAGDGGSLDFNSELRVPIIVDNEFPIIEFDEIVLVEPGEPGTLFGVEEFWDYVIVEGKKTGQSTWRKLIDGYDSRDDQEWLTSYNTGIPANGQDSEAQGDLTLFKKRTIDITNTGFFSEGDTISIRFRLFSDPFARGWGWTIDNLEIQRLAVNTIDTELDQDLVIFPNPVIGNQLFVKTGSRKELRGQIYSLDGKQLTNFNLTNSNSIIDFPFNAGTYILQVASSEGIVTRKFIKL